MIDWKGDIHRGVLYFVRPAVKMVEAMTAGMFQDIIAAKMKAGFSMELTNKYYRVLTRFADEMDKQLIEHEAAAGRVIPEVATPLGTVTFTTIKSEILTLRDVLCAMIDEELYFTPRWHNQLLAIAKEEGLLDPVEEPPW